MLNYIRKTQESNMKRSSERHLIAVAMMALSFAGCQSETNLTGNSMGDSSESRSSRLESKEGTKGANRDTPTKQSSDRTASGSTIASSERREAFKAGIDLIRESNIEKTAKQVGDAAIDGELIGWDGKTVRLSKLWHDGPVVLMWYRGGWCSHCNIQLQAMQQHLDELENAGAELVVLTPELPEKAKETSEANHLDMVALHDRENRLADAYGIMFNLPEAIIPIYRDQLKMCSYNGCNKMQLPLAATYVIDQSGKITYAFLDADYKKRAEPADIVAAVVAVVAAKSDRLN